PPAFRSRATPRGRLRMPDLPPPRFAPSSKGLHATSRPPRGPPASLEPATHSRLPMRPTLLAVALAALLPNPATAANAAPDPAETVAAASAPAAAPAEFDRVVVTATRTERDIADVPHTVDVITRQRMDELLVRDLRDLFRYEPGITVSENFGRFGIGDIRIRGLG